MFKLGQRFSTIGQFRASNKCDCEGLKGSDGTTSCSSEGKFGAVDPASSTGLLTTVCENHRDTPKTLLVRTAGMLRDWGGIPSSDRTPELSRLDDLVEAKRVDTPIAQEISRMRKKTRERIKRHKSQNKPTVDETGSVNVDDL